MQVFHDINEWLRVRNQLPFDASLGFVPTMGNLHAGHESLFKRCAKENTYSASSLFVNPTQFNQTDDFDNYPRSLDTDLQIMEASGVDFCLIPEKTAIYPDDYCYQIQENQLSTLMEGKHRPGHFNGVLTIVNKLFHLVRPKTAYFGEKDYQQYLLIQGMAHALFMNIAITPCPTIREPSGLAYSSRNNRLNKEQKQLAIEYATLFHQHNSCETIAHQLEQKGIEVEYIEEYQGRRYIAVVIGNVRLIDNYGC